MRRLLIVQELKSQMRGRGWSAWKAEVYALWLAGEYDLFFWLLQLGVRGWIVVRWKYRNVLIAHAFGGCGK